VPGDRHAIRALCGDFRRSPGCHAVGAGIPLKQAASPPFLLSCRCRPGAGMRRPPALCAAPFPSGARLPHRSQVESPARTGILRLGQRQRRRNQARSPSRVAGSSTRPPPVSGARHVLHPQHVAQGEGRSPVGVHHRHRGIGRTGRAGTGFPVKAPATRRERTTCRRLRGKALRRRPPDGTGNGEGRHKSRRPAAWHGTSGPMTGLALATRLPAGRPLIADACRSETAGLAPARARGWDADVRSL